MVVKSKGIYQNYIVPLAKALDKAQWKGFAIMYGIWLVDLLTTAIALGWFGDHLSEGNPAASAFFNLGLFGWGAWMCFCALVLMGLLYLPEFLSKITLWSGNKKSLSVKDKNLYKTMRLFNVLFIFITEFVVIINNIKNIIQVK